MKIPHDDMAALAIFGGYNLLIFLAVGVPILLFLL